MIDINFSVMAAANLTSGQRQQIKQLCIEAFDEDPWSQYQFMADAIHVLGVVNHQVVTHALWTNRFFQFGTFPLLKTAYVEYVATLREFQGQGLASDLLKYLLYYLSFSDYKLAALNPENISFYERLGWQLWQGHLAIRKTAQWLPTPDDEIMLHYFNDLESELCLMEDQTLLSADWREGELW